MNNRTTVSQSQLKRFKSSTIHHMPCVIDNHMHHYALFETSFTADQTAKRFNQYAGQDVSGYHWNPIITNNK